MLTEFKAEDEATGEVWKVITLLEPPDVPQVKPRGSDKLQNAWSIIFKTARRPTG